MSSDPSNLTQVMAQAVEASIRHVESGGLPFVGVVHREGRVISEYGVNRVLETGDPWAHAEIVAMKDAMATQGGVDLAGAALLATGEPCGRCYRFAIDQRVESIYVAADRDAVSDLGFDYRSSYAAFGITERQRSDLMHALPVNRALEPFTTYQQLRATGAARRPPIDLPDC